jgi:hypothetical protein
MDRTPPGRVVSHLAAGRDGGFGRFLRPPWANSASATSAARDGGILGGVGLSAVATKREAWRTGLDTAAIPLLLAAYSIAPSHLLRLQAGPGAVPAGFCFRRRPRLEGIRTGGRRRRGRRFVCLRCFVCFGRFWRSRRFRFFRRLDALSRCDLRR